MPDDIEIGYSPLRMLRLVGMGAVMTLLSVSVAFNWFSSKRIDSLHVLIAYVGIAFFGLATLKFIWMLLTAKGPVVFISRYGIRDMRIADELIPWDCVEDVSAREYRRQKFVALRVSPMLEKQLFATKARQALLLASKAMGMDGVTITVSGLMIDFDTLLNTCLAYYSAAKPGRGVRQRTGSMSAQG
jgi:hypothetical protein